MAESGSKVPNLEETFKYGDEVEKYVKVLTVDEEEHLGWLKSIDVLTGNLFLFEIDESHSQIIGTTLIMGDSCSSLEVLQEPSESVRALFKKYDRGFEELNDQILERKYRLIAWIKKNRLPLVVRPDHTLVVAGNVIVDPPYLSYNCHSPNLRTLKNIKKLVSNIPHDIEVPKDKQSAPRPAPSMPASTLQLAPAPAPVAQSHSPMAAPQQPGIFKQMASTSAGVVAGSAVMKDEMSFSRKKVFQGRNYSATQKKGI